MFSRIKFSEGGFFSSTAVMVQKWWQWYGAVRETDETIWSFHPIVKV